jgi:D-glycero-alpha-D-manno-heptose-7-phosphate kinase
MITSQTPYRVSFAGGGTDLPAFYREERGAVLSTAISRHMYVHIHRRFESNYRIAYSEIEFADCVAGIKHDLVRAALQLTAIEETLEITTIGDVPAGTGVGSSSALTVGLLNALYAYKGNLVSNHVLAEQACQIEIDLLGKPIGRQGMHQHSADSVSSSFTPTTR